MLTLPASIPDEGNTLTQIFIFTLLCGASKGFILHKTFWGNTEKCGNKNLS